MKIDTGGAAARSPDYQALRADTRYLRTVAPVRQPEPRQAHFTAATSVRECCHLETDENRGYWPKPASVLGWSLPTSTDKGPNYQEGWMPSAVPGLRHRQRLTDNSSNTTNFVTNLEQEEGMGAATLTIIGRLAVLETTTLGRSDAIRPASYNFALRTEAGQQHGAAGDN